MSTKKLKKILALTATPILVIAAVVPAISLTSCNKKPGPAPDDKGSLLFSGQQDPTVAPKELVYIPYMCSSQDGKKIDGATTYKLKGNYPQELKISLGSDDQQHIALTGLLDDSDELHHYDFSIEATNDNYQTTDYPVSLHVTAFPIPVPHPLKIIDTLQNDPTDFWGTGAGSTLVHNDISDFDFTWYDDNSCRIDGFSSAYINSHYHGSATTAPDTYLVYPKDSYINPNNGKTCYVTSIGDAAFATKVMGPSPVDPRLHDYMPAEIDIRLNKHLTHIGFNAFCQQGVNASSIHRALDLPITLLNINLYDCQNLLEIDDDTGMITGYWFAFSVINSFISPYWDTSLTYWPNDVGEATVWLCDLDLRTFPNLLILGSWGVGRWNMNNNFLNVPEPTDGKTLDEVKGGDTVALPSKIQTITWATFSGSYIDNLYWDTVLGPDDMSWRPHVQYYVPDDVTDLFLYFTCTDITNMYINSLSTHTDDWSNAINNCPMTFINHFFEVMGVAFMLDVFGPSPSLLDKVYNMFLFDFTVTSV